MGALDKVLLAAEAAHEDDEVDEHLSRECPWYRAVREGKQAVDHTRFCTPPDPLAAGDGGALVKFTPHTAEASTVEKPTVPPGGPGLFHVKGMELPPYIQHLWFHLVKEYGKQKAYGVAVGVVKKWAAGINPGGKHPTKTHADVRAAAAKNVAEWEQKRATAHAQHRATEARHASEHQKVAATMQLAAESFPGEKLQSVIPVPKSASAMYVAHRVDDLTHSLAHARERLGAARDSKVQGFRNYTVLHVGNHLSKGLDDAHQLVTCLQENYPAEAREFATLLKTMGLARSLSSDAKVATTAHLLQTVFYHMGHAKRHTETMRVKPGAPAVWDFNAEHAERHLDGAAEHVFKLARHLRDNYPEVARWLTMLDHDTDYTNAADVKLAAVNMGTGKSGMREPFDGTPLRAPGAKPALLPPPPGGTYSQYGLHQQPSQTVSPSPPLPPEVPLPTAAEVRKLIGQVPDVIEPKDEYLSATVRKFLEQSAVKLDKNDLLMALSMLRSTQAALRAAHKADVRAGMPAMYTANVFAKVPAGEMSSANTAVLQTREQALAWRKLEQEVAAMVDRMRKRYFHGVYNGPSQEGRFTSTEEDMSSVDKVLALVGAPIVTGKDVSFPADSDLTQRKELLQSGKPEDFRLSPKAEQDLTMMSPVDRLRCVHWMNQARDFLAKNWYLQGTEMLLRVKNTAFVAARYKLESELSDWLRSIQELENDTIDPAKAILMRNNHQVIAPDHRRQEIDDSGNSTPAKLSARLAGEVSLAAAAGKSAGTSAGKSSGKPKSSEGQTVNTASSPSAEHLHQLHMEHLEHLHHLHVEHVRHINHLAHVFTHGATPAARENAALQEAAAVPPTG